MGRFTTQDTAFARESGSFENTAMPPQRLLKITDLDGWRHAGAYFSVAEASLQRRGLPQMRNLARNGKDLS